LEPTYQYIDTISNKKEKYVPYEYARHADRTIQSFLKKLDVLPNLCD